MLPWNSHVFSGVALKSPVICGSFFLERAIFQGSHLQVSVIALTSLHRECWWRSNFILYPCCRWIWLGVAWPVVIKPIEPLTVMNTFLVWEWRIYIAIKIVVTVLSYWYLLSISIWLCGINNSSAMALVVSIGLGRPGEGGVIVSRSC